MTIAKVSRDEVKRCFLLANKGKALFKEQRLSRSELEDSYSKLLEDINTLEEEQLDGLFKDKTRLRRYDEMIWYEGRAAFSEMGSWPKMTGIDIRLTTGNIVETTEGIKLVRSKKSNLYVPEKFWKKLASLEENLDFVYPNFPLVLFPGGEVREKDYNTWAKENNEPLCRIFKYDIDDGNYRAVAYVSSSLIEAPVFVGVSII
ncbi:hypothetical protein HYV49_04050 [Candidatus Pacearchaeota archaeon]|nr:hypothetical protein [Candidatus Pacearchaeota archaeon]